MKTKQVEILFYKICPDKKCRTISGFSLLESDIEKDEEYICGGCGGEYQLSRYKKATQKQLEIQKELRKNEIKH